jgi:Arc/MetJ-type ribon-helix-helix transcriptional regulator
MVKSTVRFPEEVMNKVEKMVDEGACSHKSEFQRVAVEYALSEATDHDPAVVDFDEIYTEIFPEQTEEYIAEAAPGATEEGTFIQIATRVRQFGRRGKITTAEEYIDTHYPASDPRSMLLDDMLAPYRNQVREE